MMVTVKGQMRTFDVCHPQKFSFTYLGGDGRSPPWSPWSRSCGELREVEGGMYVSLKSLEGDRRSPPCPPWVSFFPSHFHCNYIGAHCKFSLNSYLCAKSRAASPVKWVEEYSRCLDHLMFLVYVYRHVYVLNKL